METFLLRLLLEANCLTLVRPIMERSSSKDKTSYLFNRYLWLVDTVFRAGRISFEEINKKWLSSSLNVNEEEIPLRTFHNHRKAIEQMFDINIECDKRSGYLYFIENSDDLERGGVRQWLDNTFAINLIINESYKLKDRILFENIPSGQKFLVPIIEAMKDGVSIEISYQNIRNTKAKKIEVNPYCVKVFRQRWYLVGLKCSNNTIAIYALDRILNILHTGKGFVMPSDFDPKGHFYNCFGIINQHKPDEVLIKVFKKDKKDKYLKLLPLHHSQKEVSSTNEYTIFQYYVQPNYDFRMELLSHGSDIEVLSPKRFRDEISQIIKTQNKRYKPD